MPLVLVSKFGWRVWGVGGVLVFGGGNVILYAYNIYIYIYYIPISFLVSVDDFVNLAWMDFLEQKV